MPHPLFDPDLPGVERSTLDAFRAFKRSMVLHRRLMMTMLSGDEMHPAQAGCLQSLVHHDGISQSDLADILHVSRPTVTTMLQRMEATGTIERRQDESDSRVTRVYLTQEGHRLADRMREVIAEVLNLSIGEMSGEDRAELTRLLEMTNGNMEAALAERGCAPGHWHGRKMGGSL